MPHPKVHAEDSIRVFGQSFIQVHEWLDAFHDVPGYGGVAHRRKRHHQAGINEIRRMWGETAAQAAHQHIMADLEQVGWTGQFPKDEADCIKLGLWITR